MANRMLTVTVENEKNENVDLVFHVPNLKATEDKSKQKKKCGCFPTKQTTLIGHPKQPDTLMENGTLVEWNLQDNSLSMKLEVKTEDGNILRTQTFYYSIQPLPSPIIVEKTQYQVQKGADEKSGDFVLHLKKKPENSSVNWKERMENMRSAS